MKVSNTTGKKPVSKVLRIKQTLKSGVRVPPSVFYSSNAVPVEPGPGR